MSFILDALRRAESQRANQPRTVTTDGSLGDVAEKSSSMPAPRWIAVLLVGATAAVMLAVNILSPEETAAPAYTQPDYRSMTPAQTAAFSTVAPDTPLAEVAASTTRVVRPLGAEARNTSPAESRPTRPGSVSVSQEPLSATDTPARSLTNLPDTMAANETGLPSYTDAALSGRGMPAFHLDIHVYSREPERRFVFVNNRKYREGQQLDEGGTVERITPAGVVLNHRGRRFELFPD